MPAPHAKKTREKGVKVKREPTEVKPLSDYVDDRLELIKQAFSCLRTKTIQGITPKSLQKDSLESIQEKCLDEVLGISKKRLLSIINDTKCPTDTESSDDDDDVDEIIEHISLDEISSDEDSKAKLKKKRKPDAKAPTKKIKEEKPVPEKKEYSVLELLELQARARAIRSQLALEPVTKIELDGDESEEDEQDKNAKIKDKPESKKKKSTASTSSPKKTTNGNSTRPSRQEKGEKKTSPKAPMDTNPPSTSSKPIKIKRNFRKQITETEVSKPLSEKKEDIPELAKARESSPEVETIQAIPETLCISSSEDEETEKTQEVNKEAPSASILKETPIIPKEDPEEGEIGDESTENIVADKVDNIPEPIVAEPPAQEHSISEKQKDNSNVSRNESKDLDGDVLCVQLDDDCIDLECDDQMEEDDLVQTKEKPEEAPNKEVNEETVEVLDSSADEEVGDKDSASNDSKSWGERWLGSSKVSKILATSKLGNTVRRKIKLSKQKEKMDSIEITVETRPVSQVVRAPEADDGTELGSVDHYKKIVEKSNSRSE